MTVVVRFAAVGEVDDGLLTDAERARRDRLVLPADRAAYAAAHVLVRECAAELLGVRAAEVVLAQRCPTCGGEDHGRPCVAGHGIHVSLSHTQGRVAAVAATARCGIDVEPVHAGPPPRGTLTDREAAWVAAQSDPGLPFTRLWVRKEALVKVGVVALEDAARFGVLGPDGPADEVAGVRLTEWYDGAAVGAVALA